MTKENPLQPPANENVSGQMNGPVNHSEKEDNREGMEEVADIIARQGSFADENRRW